MFMESGHYITWYMYSTRIYFPGWHKIKENSKLKSGTLPITKYEQNHIALIEYNECNEDINFVQFNG